MLEKSNGKNFKIAPSISITISVIKMQILENIIHIILHLLHITISVNVSITKHEFHDKSIQQLKTKRKKL